MLYIMGGLPGVGKSTLARGLAQRVGAVYLRVDTVEQAMRDAGVWADGPAGYGILQRLAAENLRLGRDVVADSVNPLAITRDAWTAVARESGSKCVEIEVMCSDREQHRKRVETRTSDIAGLTLPAWDNVLGRSYEPWTTRDVCIDTAHRTVDESLSALLEALRSRRG